MPEMDEGAFVLDYHAGGDAAGESDRACQVMGGADGVPEVDGFCRQASGSAFATSPDVGDSMVRLSAAPPASSTLAHEQP